MKIIRKLAASCTALSYLFVAAPAYAIIYNNPIEASMARCEQVTGREKDRCESIHRRVERLRLRQTTKTYTRGNTLREQRVLLPTTKTTNIRRTNQVDMSRLRTHDGSRGNSRRLINIRDESARSTCKDVPLTEKSQCIRDQWKSITRGNVK